MSWLSVPCSPSWRTFMRRRAVASSMRILTALMLLTTTLLAVALAQFPQVRPAAWVVRAVGHDRPLDLGGR